MSGLKALTATGRIDATRENQSNAPAPRLPCPDCSGAGEHVQRVSNPSGSRSGVGVSVCWGCNGTGEDALVAARNQFARLLHLRWENLAREWVPQRFGWYQVTVITDLPLSDAELADVYIKVTGRPYDRGTLAQLMGEETDPVTGRRA